jgi:hypothetical protein
MQTVLLIFIAIFSLAIGFFLGMFLLSLDTPFSKRLTKKEESTTEDQVSEIKDYVSGSTVSDAQVKKPSPNSHLILQIWKEEGKPPVYDMNGTYLEKEALPPEILNIISLHQDVPVQTPIPESPPPPVETEETTNIVSDEQEGEQEVKMLSVIDEVNDIIQKKLAGSPLAGKGIHLMENHNREIRFWVGLNSYSDVDEIPDQEIRQLIDEAVKEWEQNRK